MTAEDDEIRRLEAELAQLQTEALRLEAEKTCILDRLRVTATNNAARRGIAAMDDPIQFPDAGFTGQSRSRNAALVAAVRKARAVGYSGIPATQIEEGVITIEAVQDGSKTAWGWEIKKPDQQPTVIETGET